MRKRVVNVLLLLFSLLLIAPTAMAQTNEPTFQLDIDTWTTLEGKRGQLPGTGTIDYWVYDLTEWYYSQKGTPEDIRKDFADNYGKKESCLEFVQKNTLKKIYEAPVKAGADGKVSFALPINQGGQETVYLIFGEGETDVYKAVPILLTYSMVKEDIEAALPVVVKFYEERPTPPTPSDKPKPPIPTDDPPTTTGSLKDLPRKNLPVTGEQLRSYLSVGGAMITVGLLGLIIKKNKKK